MFTTRPAPESSSDANRYTPAPSSGCSTRTAGATPSSSPTSQANQLWRSTGSNAKHAHVEENIKRLKTCGLDRFPFPDTARNKIWTSMVGWAHTLCRWFQLDLLAGTEFEHAHPKKLRRCLFNTPAILRVRNRQTWTLWPKHWPWNPHLRNAGRRLRTMNQPTPLQI
jgi:hypothetical protein